MRSGSLSMSTRAVVGGILAAILWCGASAVRAEQAPAQGGQATAPAGQTPPAQADPFLITAEQALIIFQVDPTKTADWESAWAESKTKLSALADKPDYKALGESIHMFKVAGASADPAQPAIYVLHLSPPAKVSYDPTKFLFAPGVMPRAEADAIFAKISASFKGVNVLPLTKVGG